MYKFFFFLFVIAASPFSLEAEEDSDSFAERWQARATKTQAQQPKWAVPMVSTFPMVAQVFRTDFTRQSPSAQVQNWNLGAGKGFNLIPFARTQVDVLIPGFVKHGDRTPDGFGDVPWLVKYRLFAGNERHHDYIFSAILSGTVPTGSHTNGAATNVLTPTLSGGKGFGRFDVMSSLGAGLPTSKTETAGRTLHSNTVLQYHASKYLWPELEMNSTRYIGGARDGKTQTFLTPGLVVGKIALHPENPKSRTGVVAGVAFQTAVTSFHTYNHAVVVSLRFAF
ncbi:MAG TPA: hypothetical protein VK627_01955 [Edaphobacter sp.]|nr:hypothetical protein [Edaphobacter sp.]